MTMTAGLAALFSRDLTRLIQELQAFPGDETVWQLAPGVKNSAGNLVLHLEGNLRERVKDLVAKVVGQLSEGDLAAAYPERLLETTLSSHDFLVHLHGHLNYHLGQIDYLRRILTEGSAVAFAGL